MKRLGWVFVLALLLAGCQQSASVLSWVSPSSASTVTGTVTLSVQAQGDHASAVRGVVFYMGDKQLGSARREGDLFTLSWNTTGLEPDDYRLRAVPYGGPGITQIVTVAKQTNGGVVTTPGTPAEGARTQDDDPLNLDWVLGFWPGLAQSPAGEAVAQAPSDFPWAALWPAEVVRAKLRGALYPFQGDSDVVGLPRGEVFYDSVLAEWVVTPAEVGGLVITFDYLDPETLANRTVSIDLNWDEYAPTTVVEAPNGRIEMPQGAWLLVQNDDEALLDLDITTSYFTPPGCTAQALFPESLLLKGFINQTRPEDADEGTSSSSPAEVVVTNAQEEGDPDEVPKSTLETTDLLLELSFEETNRRRDSYTLTSSLEMGATTVEGFEALLSWMLVMVGDVSFEDCILTGATLGEMNLYTSAMFGPEAGPYRGSSLGLELSNLLYNEGGIPLGTEIDAELTVFDEASAQEDATTALASLVFDNETGLKAEGEVTLPDGTREDLLEYLTRLWERYQQRAQETATLE